MRVVLAVAAALCPVAYAFLETVPLLAWSSHQSSSLDALPPNPAHTSTLLEQILLNDNVCALDAIILVSQNGLHASDLRTLPRSSAFVKSFYDAPSQRQFEYLTIPPEADSLPVVAEALAERCGARLVSFRPGVNEGYFEYEHAKKNVVNVELPSLAGLSGADRKRRMSLSTSQLADELSFLASTFPNHLIIYTAPTPEDEHSRRQLPSNPSPSVRPLFDFDGTFVYAPETTPAPPKGGILKRYQLLTPGLITGLLVTLFILLPIVFVGFSALASIQSPLRGEAPKTFKASEKKTQ